MEGIINFPMDSCSYCSYNRTGRYQTCAPHCITLDISTDFSHDFPMAFRAGQAFLEWAAASRNKAHPGGRPPKRSLMRQGSVMFMKFAMIPMHIYIYLIYVHRYIYICTYIHICGVYKLFAEFCGDILDPFG